YRGQVESHRTSRIKYSKKYEMLSAISKVFGEIKHSVLTRQEAEGLLFKLNLSLGREYDTDRFFLDLEKNSDGTVSLNELKRCFVRYL
ncbi:hypothetical protein BpHYR1_027086, partial [Brachionus plicatilis]